jgi:hypothetical protein
VTDDLERWLADRLAQERERTFDMVSQATARLLNEYRAEREREVATLRRSISELQEAVAQIHAQRLRAIAGNESADAKKLN